MNWYFLIAFVLFVANFFVSGVGHLFLWVLVFILLALGLAEGYGLLPAWQG